MGRDLTLFVDAAAPVSIIAGEEDGESLALQVIADPDPIWSAKANGAELLYKGDDFIHTDLA